MYSVLKFKIHKMYQRGGERGTIGGHQGTCIKDTWTKLKQVGSKVGGGDG